MNTYGRARGKVNELWEEAAACPPSLSILPFPYVHPHIFQPQSNTMCALAAKVSKKELISNHNGSTRPRKKNCKKQSNILMK
jgi:hypothetical protein